MILVAVVALAAVGCSSQQPNRDGAETRAQIAGKQQARGNADDRDRTELGERAAAIALRQVGVPYRFGGNTPTGFDCSGLVQYSYAHAGKSLPRTTAGLWAELAPVDARQMQTGDLLFFNVSGKMSHVGLYLGDGRFVHAPSSGKAVAVESLQSDYYRTALIRAGRPR